MGRMTITVDEQLVERVREILAVRTKAEAIRLALKEVIRRKQLDEALSHRGTIELDLDQATLQRLRAER